MAQQATRDLEPWQVPPDEAYWRALLQEGEYGEGMAEMTGSPPHANHKPELLEEIKAHSEPLAVSPVYTPDAPASDPNGTGGSPGVLAKGPDVLDPPRHTPAEARQPGQTVGMAAVPPIDHPADDLFADDSVDDDSPATTHTAPGEPGCWDVFAEYQAEGQLVNLEVEGYNRGGLLVRWMDVLGFVPASQLCDGLRYGDEHSRLDDLSARVGTSLTLRVIEVDGAKSRLIFSERAARHIQDPDLTVLDELNAGDVCRGTITNLCTFGAFVDLGGVEGLIHISELSWGRVGHPSDVLQSGQEVEVYILNVDRDQGRVGLSLKRLQPDPWDHVEERYAVNQIIEGTVTNIVNFGAFVRLEEGLEGLIHASELKGETMPSLYALREGELVIVRINSIEGSRHRIGLSLESL